MIVLVTANDPTGGGQREVGFVVVSVEGHWLSDRVISPNGWTLPTG